MKKDRFGRMMANRPNMDWPMKRFEQTAGAEKIKEVLSWEEHPRYIALLSMMNNPQYAAWSFAAKCREANVTLHELQKLYNDANTQLAMMRMSDYLPDVAEDVAKDALSTETGCERCDGKGTIAVVVPKDFTVTDEGGIAIPPPDRECPACAGVGKIRQAGNKDARQLMFQGLGVIGNGKMSLAMANQMSVGEMDGEMEGILKLTQAVVVKVGT